MAMPPSQVPNPWTAVATAPDRQIDVGIPRGLDTGDDVVGVGDAHDGPGPLVDHAVVDAARLVVTGISGPDHLAMDKFAQTTQGYHFGHVASLTARAGARYRRGPAASREQPRLDRIASGYRSRRRSCP